MSQEKVLVVDDEVDFASFVMEVVTGMGRAAETCQSTKDARIVYERFRPDLVMLDIVMPDEDGIEFLNWLAGQEHRSRVILVTGYHPDYATAAHTLGMLAGIDIGPVVFKPVHAESLREALV